MGGVKMGPSPIFINLNSPNFQEFGGGGVSSQNDLDFLDFSTRLKVFSTMLLTQEQSFLVSLNAFMCLLIEFTYSKAYKVFLGAGFKHIRLSLSFLLLLK